MLVLGLKKTFKWFIYQKIYVHLKYTSIQMIIYAFPVSILDYLLLIFFQTLAEFTTKL